MTTRREILATAAWIIPAADGQVLVTLDEVTQPTEPPIEPPPSVGANVVKLQLRSDPRDQSKAWDDALAEAASRGWPLELEPGQRYVGMAARNGDNTNDAQAAFGFPADLANVIVQTRGNPPVGDPTQATLTVPPWEGRRGIRWQCIVRMSGQNQYLRSVRIDGNKLSAGSTKAARENWLVKHLDYSKGGNSGTHNIAIRGGIGCSLVDVESFDAMTDGLDIDESGAEQVRDFLALRCDFHHNRRQGLSTKQGGTPDGGIDQLIFSQCRFRWTGDDERGMVGQAPGYGVDMEPNNSNSLSYGFTFRDCESSDNQGATFHNGQSRGRSAGRAFSIENNGTHTDLRIIRLSALRNRGSVKVNMRGQDIVRLHIEGLIAQGNGESNRLWFAREGGKLIDARLIDIDVSEIFFQSNLDPSGHSVDIWRGSYAPKITADCKVITARDGMP